MRIGRWILLAIALAAAGQVQAKPEVGDVAPNALGVDIEKRPVQVSDYRGKVVVLSFWASWCGYCLKELPILENLQRIVGAERIAVIAVNVDKDRSDYTSMRRRMKGYQMTMTRDELKQGIANDYAVGGLPHMVVVDKEGLIAKVHVGYSEKMLPSFVDGINALLEEPAGAPSGP